MTPLARLLAVTLVALALVPGAVAQPSDDVRRLVLVDGTTYVGAIEDESADPVVIITRDGVRREFPRSRVREITPLIDGRFFRLDPVQTRHFLTPTARTMGGGTRIALTPYPSATTSLSERVDLLATGYLAFGDEFALTPLVGLKGQLYASESAQVALGASAVASFGGETVYGAVPYLVATFGDRVSSISIGAGGLIGGVGDEIEVADAIILGLGADRQINNGVKLFVEVTTAFGETTNTYFDVGTGQTVTETSFESVGVLIVPGVRLFGDHIALDVIGFIATDLDTLVGFAPIPARISYRF